MTVALGLNQADVEKRILIFGYNEIPEKRKNPLLLLLKKFWGISAWMLELIIGLSFWLDRYSDAYIVIGLLLVNAIIGFFQEYSADNAVEALKKKLQINVRVAREGSWKSIPARELVPDDVARFRKGDFVTADLRVSEGEAKVDQSSLTGESMEVEKQSGAVVYSGSVITSGEITGVITSTGSNTFYGKTISLLRIAKPKSRIDQVVIQVVKWLLIMVGSLLAVALISSYFQGINILEILPLMLVLLLGAIPVALSAMFTVSMALGSRQLVDRGVLVTRLNAPDDAASMDILCVDKTGTLTMNKLTIAEVTPTDRYSENELILFGALASQEANRDAIDSAFIDAARQRGILETSFVQEEFSPFDPKNRRTEALIEHEGKRFRVMKGSFKIIAAICKPSPQASEDWARIINGFAKRGYRTLAVAEGNSGGTFEFVGVVAMHDPPRADSKEIIAQLKKLGVSVKMLTGDSKPVANEIVREVGMGSIIVNATELTDTISLAESLTKCDGVSEVFPEDKYRIIKALQSTGHVVGMTGDGVNDAPALKQAEVGIAVNNATDIAKSAASIILINDGLSGIISPIKVGRMMFERINVWILNKFARTVLKTCFIVVSFLTLGKFVVSATAMLIMIFMTDFVKIFLSTDNVKYGPSPAKWQIDRQVLVGAVIGIMMTLEALSLLYFGLKYFQLQNDDAALQTFCFEILLFFALFSIIIVREKEHFWSSAPSNTLLAIIVGDFVAGSTISTVGLLGFHAIPLTQTISVIVFTSISSLLFNDFIKYRLIRKLGGENRNTNFHVAVRG